LEFSWSASSTSPRLIYFLFDQEEVIVVKTAPEKDKARSVELAAGRAGAVLEITVWIHRRAPAVRHHRAKDVIVIKTLNAGILSFNLRDRDAHAKTQCKEKQGG
jgi:hypothetical protein